MATITGTSGNDSLVGTVSNDTILPGTGHDNVDGRSGNDLLIVDYSGNTFAGTADRPAGMSFYSGYPTDENGRIILVSGGIVANKPVTDNDSVSFRDMDRFFITGTNYDDQMAMHTDWVSNDTLLGLGGNDNIFAGGGNDRVLGGDGDDTLNGGTGNNYVDGGDGNDWVVTAVSGYDGSESDTVLGGAGIDTLDGADFSQATKALKFTDDGSTQQSVTVAKGTTASGFEYIDHLATGTGNDSVLYSLVRDNLIHTNAGNDTINPGLGNDNVDGGYGTDLLIVDYSANSFAGTSGRAAGLSFYSGYIENEDGRDVLVSGGAVANRATGTDSIAFRDMERFQITGTEANDTLSIFSSWVSNDTLDGGAGNDILAAGAGNDLVIGGSGRDTMYGDAGNDTYSVDSTLDVVIEAAGYGTDLVNSAVSYTLGANLENLALIGSRSVAATGNELANRIFGNAGNNPIDGGSGADTMAGGAGNDTYSVDNAGDQVIESANAGIDTVLAHRTFTLSANVENLTITGTGDYTGVGNTLANTLAGNSGDNQLVGGGGNDLLLGGQGADTLTGIGGQRGRNEIDTLTGGSGADLFDLGNGVGAYYNDGNSSSAGTADYALITDFTAGSDQLRLSGQASDYHLGSPGVSGVSGTGLFLETGGGNELIAILRSANSTSLTEANTIDKALFV